MEWRKNLHLIKTSSLTHKADESLTLKSESDISLVSECCGFDINEALSETSQIISLKNKYSDYSQHRTVAATISELEGNVTTEILNFRQDIPEYFKNLQPCIQNRSIVTLIHMNHGITKYIKHKIVGILAQNKDDIRKHDFENVLEQIQDVFINLAHLPEKEATLLTKCIVTKAHDKYLKSLATEINLEEIIQKEVEKLYHQRIIESINHTIEHEDSFTENRYKINKKVKFEPIQNFLRPDLKNSKRIINNISQYENQFAHPRPGPSNLEYKVENKNKSKCVNTKARNVRESFFNTIYNHGSEMEDYTRNIMVASAMNKDNNPNTCVSLQTVDNGEEQKTKVKILTMNISMSESKLKPLEEKINYTLIDWLESWPVYQIASTKEKMHLKSAVAQMSTDIQKAMEMGKHSEEVNPNDILRQEIKKQLKSILITDPKKQKDEIFMNETVDHILIFLTRHNKFASEDFLVNSVNYWLEHLPIDKNNSSEYDTEQVRKNLSLIENLKTIKARNIQSSEKLNHEIREETIKFLKDSFMTHDKKNDKAFLKEKANELIQKLSGYPVQLSKIIPDTLKPADTFCKVIEEWCDNLPLQEGPVESVALKRPNLTRKIINQVGEINRKSYIFNDDSLYTNTLQDTLIQFLSEINDSKLNESLPDEINKLMTKIMQTRRKMLNEEIGKDYVLQLKNATRYTLSNAGLCTQGLCVPVDLFENILTDAFMLFLFAPDNEAEICFYKYKKELSKQVRKLFGARVSQEICKDLDRKILEMDIHNALLSVPIPPDNCLKNEIEQVRIRAIVSEFAEDIPLEQSTKKGQLQRNKLLKDLAKSLQSIEQEHSLTSESMKEEEITKLFKKLCKGNYFAGQMPKFIKSLMSKLQATEKSREFSPFRISRTTKAGANKCTGTVCPIISEQDKSQTKAYENKWIGQISNDPMASISTSINDLISCNQQKCVDEIGLKKKQDFTKTDKINITDRGGFYTPQPGESHDWLLVSCKPENSPGHVVQEYHESLRPCMRCPSSDFYRTPCRNCPWVTAKRYIWGDFGPERDQLVAEIDKNVTNPIKTDVANIRKISFSLDENKEEDHKKALCNDKQLDNYDLLNSSDCIWDCLKSSQLPSKPKCSRRKFSNKEIMSKKYCLETSFQWSRPGLQSKSKVNVKYHHVRKNTPIAGQMPPLRSNDDIKNLPLKIWELRSQGYRKIKSKRSDTKYFDNPCLRHRGRPVRDPRNAKTMDDCDCSHRVIISRKGEEGYLEVCQLCGMSYPIPQVS